MANSFRTHSADQVIAWTDTGLILFSYGTTAPADGASGYAPGAIFIDSDTGTIYINESTTTADFNRMSTEATQAFGALTATSLAASAVDGITVNGVIIPQFIDMAFSVAPLATITEYDLWTAPAAFQVTGINYMPSTLQGGALTATVVKATSTATPVKTTTPMHTADAINLNTGAYTLQPITLTVTAADLVLAAGDRISVDLSGAHTAAKGVIGVRMKRV